MTEPAQQVPADVAPVAAAAPPARVKAALAVQDLATLDVSTLNPLSPQVISRQATINIGTIGHVAHGKSTVVKAISGVLTVRFTTEFKRNITIKLGYANAKIYKCENPECNRPECYKSHRSSTEDTPPCERPGCGGTMKLLRHVSFVDCPGHDVLMATMLNGAAVMDAALLLIAGNESCPQPQTSEHIAAIEIMNLRNIIILQNKIDLVKEAAATEQYGQILKFIQGTVAEGAPIIPISAQMKYNIDVICEYIVKKIPIPIRDFTSEPRLIVIRSFDVNKPGARVEDLKGGVAGGSILKGVLRVGDEVEVRPGVITKDLDGKMRCSPLFSKIITLYTEDNDLQYAVPGGLIGVGTKIDPSLCRADRLVGQVLGAVGKLPEIFTSLEVNFFLLRRLLGVKSEGGEKQSKVRKLTKDDTLMVNIGSTSTGCRVTAVKHDLAKLMLLTPVCTQEGEKIALSRRVEKNWRTMGDSDYHKLRNFVKAKDEDVVAQKAPEGHIRLEITHSVLSDDVLGTNNWKNYPLDTTFSQFKEKLHRIVGTEPKYMTLQVREADKTTIIQTLDGVEDTVAIGSIACLHDGLNVHIVDTDPNNFVAELQAIEKHEHKLMSDAEYEAREGTYRKFVQAQKKEQEAAAPAAAAAVVDENEVLPTAKIGDRCMVTSDDLERIGEVAYIGRVDGTPGYWIGVKLDLPMGKNDGSLKGKRYFDCFAKYGCFVRSKNLTTQFSVKSFSTQVYHWYFLQVHDL
eukprot:gene3779-4358_t